MIKLLKLDKKLRKIFHKLTVFRKKLIKKNFNQFFTGQYSPKYHLLITKLKKIISIRKKTQIRKQKIKILLRSVSNTKALNVKILASLLKNRILNRSLQEKFNVFTITISPVKSNRLIKSLSLIIQQLSYMYQTFFKHVGIDYVVLLAFLTYIRTRFLKFYFSNVNAHVSKQQKQKIFLAYQHALKVQDFYFKKVLLQTEHLKDRFVIAQRSNIQFKLEILGLNIGVKVPTLLQLLPYFLLDHFLVKPLTKKQLKELDLPGERVFVLFDEKTGTTSFFNPVVKWKRVNNMNHLPSNKLVDTCDIKSLYHKSRETGHHLLSVSLIKRLIKIAELLSMNTIFVTVPTKLLAKYKYMVYLKYLDNKKSESESLDAKIKLVASWTRYRMNVLFHIFRQKNFKVEIFDWESLLNRSGAYTRALTSNVDEVIPTVVDFYQLKAPVLSRNDLPEKIIIPQDFINFLLNWYEQKQLPLNLFKQALEQVQIMGVTCPDELEFAKQFAGFKFNWVCDGHQKKINAIFINRYSNVVVCLRDKKPKFVRDLIQKFQKQLFSNYDNRLNSISKTKFFISSIQQLKQNDCLLPFESLDVLYEQIQKFNFFNHNFFVLVRVWDNFFVKQNSSAQLIANYNKAFKYGVTNSISTMDDSLLQESNNLSKFFLSGFTVLKIKKLLLHAVKKPGTFSKNVIKPLVNTIISPTYDSSYFSNLTLVVGITQPDLTHTLSFIPINKNKFTLNNVVIDILSFLSRSDGYVTFLGFVSNDQFSIGGFRKAMVEAENESKSNTSTLWKHSFQIDNTTDFEKIINKILLTTNLYSNIELHYLQQFFHEFRLVYNFIFQNAYIEFQKYQQTLALPSNETFLKKAQTNYEYLISWGITNCIVFIEYSGQYLGFYSLANVAENENYGLVFQSPGQAELRKIFIMHPDAKVVAILHLEDNPMLRDNFQKSIKNQLVKHKLLPGLFIKSSYGRRHNTFYYNFFNHLENKSVTNSVLGLFCEMAHSFNLDFALEPNENLQFYTKTLKDKYSKPIKK